MMLTRYEVKIVQKIFKETYKRAEVVRGEGEDFSGNDSINALAAAVGGALTGQVFGAAMKKWVDRLESIQYVSPKEENLTKQILYLHVISMMCRDAEGKGIFHYQVQAITNVLTNIVKVPITFGLQKKSIDRPIIFINKRFDETDEAFLQKNPLLRDIWKQNKTLAGSSVVSSIVLDLFELTQKNITSNGRLQPYIDWIAAVITMYCHMCLSRNNIAISKLKEMGLTFEHILAGISQTTNKDKNKNKEKIEPLDKKLIAAYILAARVMYIDNQLFPSLYTYNNRCYFWETVHQSDAHKTMYRWEKAKFFRGFEDNNRFLKEESDQHENMAMGQLREHVYQFFSSMPEVLQSFLYSFESRRYTKKDVTSVLTLMFNYIDAANSLIECELVDSKFIYRMLMAAATIFISYHYQDMPHTEEDKSWIYMVLQVAKKTKRIKERIEILEYKTLRLLEVICRFRLNSQVLIFLQLFRQYVEKNQMSHVYQNSRSFDSQFQVIFQLYQFNVGHNLTFRTLERISHNNPSIIHATKAYKGNNSRVISAQNSADQSRLGITGQTGIAPGAEAEDPLLNIADIILTEIAKDEFEEEEIGDDGEAIKKGGEKKASTKPTEGNLAEENDEAEIDLENSEIGAEDKQDKVRRAKQYNDRYEIDMFLLYLIFAKKTNRGMRNLAVKILVNNFNQRELLMHELTKIELIISAQDQDYYNYFQQQHFMIKGMIEKVHQLAIEMRAAGGNGRARDVVTYQSLIDNLVFILKGLTKNLIDHVDIIRVSEGEDIFIQQENARLVKKQNMLRHIGIAKDLIEDLMEKIIDTGSFKKEIHVDLFKEVSRFMFMYCYGNLSNQSILLPKLDFFVQLTDVDVPTPKLISMIMSQQKETEVGIEFLNYLTDRIFHTKGDDNYKSTVFVLLALMMTKQTPQQSAKSSTIVNIEANQISVLKRLVKKNKFRKLILMDEKSSAKKIDLAVSLNQRIKELKSFSNMTKVDQTAYVALEWEAMKLHLAVIDMISASVRGCLFGRMQARKLITAEVLFDSILSEAIPFLVRRKYLRLLFETYIRALPEDNLHIDYNTPMFHDMMYYIVYEDLRQYARYYLGLLTKVGVEDQRDNDLELQRKRAMEGLAQKSIEDTRKRNMERTRQELENFKEARSKLSTLQHGQALPLIDETDKGEYWKYLSQYKKSKNEADGLLHFIADFYKNIRNASRKMSKEILEVSVKIKEVLMDMSDDLHKINEQYSENVTGVASLVLTIDYALSSIPNVKAFQTGQRFDVKAGAGGGEAQIIIDDSEDEEDVDPVKQQELIRKQQEAEDSRELDIKMASDKIINIIRDSIINQGATIRGFFSVKSFEQNYIMKKLDLKKIMKNVLGSSASNEEIEMFMTFLDTYSQEETEQRRTIQPDIATEGYVKIRIDPLKVLGNGGYATLYNFRDLENLLKKALQKLQYKPPVQKRERDEMEQGLDLQMDEDELSRACNLDLKIFTKCFFDFFHRFKVSDEISDIVQKIVFMFNQAYDEDDQEGVVKKFIQNMIRGFHTQRDQMYLLRIFNRLVEWYLPNNPVNKRNIIKAKERLAKLQKTMKDCGLLHMLLKLITKDDVILAQEAIKMLSSLLSDSNLEIQNNLLELMKENRDIFQFFSYIRDRLDKSSDFLIKLMEEKLVLRRMQLEEHKYYRDPRIDSLYNTFQQPFYIPSQSHTGQGSLNLEYEILRLSSLQNSEELKNLLKFLQMVCDNCHQGFQDYLRNQEENALETIQPLTTINIVTEVANILIKLTDKLGNLIFSEFIMFETVTQLFETLIDFVLGPNIENQKVLGGWKKFSKAVNFYLEQNMGVYQPNTTEQKAKLTIMKQCTDLILALSESIDTEFRLNILTEMVPEINVKNLKNKMVEIFHYKIGADSKKQRIYYANKKCKHYRENTLTFRKNMCERNEFCQFGHLIKFDKPIIAAGFNIFIFLFNFKEVDPHYEFLSNFDSEFKNESIFQYKKKDFQSIVNQLVNISAERQAEAVVLNDLEIEEVIMNKTEELLKENTIIRPTTKIYPELAKKLRSTGGEEEDKSNNIEYQIFEGESEEQKRRQEKLISKKATKSSKLMENRRKWCWGKCGPKIKSSSKVGADTSNSQNQNDPQDESGENQKSKRMNRIQDFLDDGKGKVQTLMEVFYEKAEKYTLEQFMMDAAIRFYISNVAEIEIDYNNILTKVMFRIPPYCTFLSRTSQKKMIFEANHESHIEKLEEFFGRKRVYQSEMKSIQKLAKKSKILRSISQKWKQLSNISFGMVLLINLLFIVFYHVEADGSTINMKYVEAEYAVSIMAIIQAFISFLVMLSYILRYHGKIQEEYLEQYKMSNRDRFSKLKGSLGYAFGSDLPKMDYASAIEQQKKDNEKEKEDELSLYKSKKLISKKDLLYSIRICIIAMKLDTYHAFNVVYFLLSLMGVFYNTVFSFLLLDIIIKIPLLQNVVQAIVQNRKQLFYTMILLFVVIYIYSYIAFSLMRDSYANNDQYPNDSLNENLYCRTLLECFTSTLNNGLRAGGGIGDVLTQISMDKKKGDYWIRYFFDLTFFCLVIILLLNLIFGIIIDAFADMRDNRIQLETDVKERCFICGLNRFEFESKNKSWLDHIQKEHNAFAYLYFILYVQAKPGNQCNGVEKYVKALILKDDAGFFPVGRCLSINKDKTDHSNIENGEEIHDIHQKH